MLRLENCPWHKCKDNPPQDGQKVYYFGPNIGLWRGTYRYCPDDPWKHLFFCDSDPVFGIPMHVDFDDAPYWREYNEEDEKRGFVPILPYKYLNLELLD